VIVIYRFAPLALALDYCRLGWAPSNALQGLHHGQYSVLMCWLCDCPLVEPER
jgi:hypothetical protein